MYRQHVYEAKTELYGMCIHRQYVYTVVDNIYMEQNHGKQHFHGAKVIVNCMHLHGWYVREIKQRQMAYAY